MKSHYIRCIGTAMALIFMSGFISHTGYAADSKSDNVTVAEAVDAPYSYVGKDVSWEGTVKMVTASGMPTKVLIQSGSFEWLSSFYNTSAVQPESLIPGARIRVEGIIIGVESVFFEGTQRDVVSLMGKETRKSNIH